MSAAHTSVHSGDCHCGRVRFEFESEPDVEIHECNCSICNRVGFQHLIIPARAFNLLTAWDELALYTFNTGVAKHYFCKRCGIYTHNVMLRFPDKCRVNIGCIDDLDTTGFEVDVFDGKNLI